MHSNVQWKSHIQRRETLELKMWQSTVAHAYTEENYTPDDSHSSKATSPQCSTLSDVASCNHPIVNGMILLGIESVMVTCDETTLKLVPHPHVNMKYRYQTL